METVTKSLFSKVSNPASVRPDWSEVPAEAKGNERIRTPQVSNGFLIPSVIEGSKIL